MTLSASDVDALAFVSGRHPGQDLVVTISLDHGDPWLSIMVNAHDQYVVSDDGAVWTSSNGIERTSLLRASAGKS